MEVVLNKLGNQPELKSVEGFFDAIQKAKTILQTPLAQCRPFERRQKCIECFGIALASNRPKFAAIAFEGIQLILRDSNFGNENGTPEGQTRAEQLLTLLTGIPNWREAATTQCQALAILVQLISSTEIPLKLKEALNAIEICKQTFDTASEESTSVRPAARAALTQMLNCYVQNRLALAETGDLVEIGALMDVTALLGELVSRMGTSIEEAVDPERIGEMRGISRRKPTHQPQPLLLPLDALFGVLSALEPNQLEKHQPLFNALKSDLLPVIICHLHGSAKCSSGQSMELGSTTTKRIGSLLKRATSRQSADSAPPHFSTISPSGIALDGAESARSFYQVVGQMLRLFTPMALCRTKSSSSNFINIMNNEILFLLEELWRSALLGPPIAKRAEAIRLAKHISNNLASFAEILQLNATTGTNSFWFLLVECLEECSTGNEQKLAIDAIRSLNALFVAISQIISIENLPKDDELYAKLAVIENRKGNEKINENNGENANKINSSSVFPQQPEPVVKIFLDGFVEQIQKWQKCETALELDEQMQEWSIAVHSMMNCILKGNDKKGRRKRSEISTPEDSGEEEDEEEEEKQDEGLSQIEMYSLVGMAILGVERKAMEWRNGQKGLQENKEEAILLEGIKMECRNMINAILRSIHDGQIDDIPPSNLNKIANLFAFDPIIQLGMRKAIVLSRWLRTLLHNCWGSIQRMLSQFPISRKSGGQSEEGKLATVEAIGSFIQLAIQIGMCTELEWSFEYIAENVCVLEELREAAKRNGDDPKAARRFCARADILAMQMLVEYALGAMQIAPKVAKYVIRCIQFLWELERWHFKLAKATIDAIYEPPSLHIPPTKSGQNSPIGQLIGSTLPNVAEFSTNELARLMDQFLASIERIFLDGPSCLPLDSFCALISAIALASEDNLKYSNGMAPTESSAQLLQFLCKLFCAKEHSPLIVKLSIWSRVKEYFVQFASSPTIPAEINRRVVDSLQDVLNSLLHWEWGGPPPKQYQQRICRIQGWNAKMFEIFPKIMETADCTLETCNQIGQIQMAFLEQNAEMIATGWAPFFASIKLIVQRSVTPSKDSFENKDALLTNSIIEILQKFLRIQKPTLLIVAFGPYLDALIHLIELIKMDGTEEQSIFILLENSERILVKFLLGSVIPILALPRNFMEEDEAKLMMKWNEYWQKCGPQKKGKEGKKEDYLELLAELKTEIEGEEIAKQEEEEWPLMRKWLERSEECGGGQQFDGNNLEQPWTHLGVKTDRIIAKIIHKFMENLMEITLKCEKAKATKLAVNLAEMLAKISNEIGPNFGVFCLCSAILCQFRHKIDSPLTNSAARSLKQLLGIICAHSAVAELIERKTTTGERDEKNGKRPMDVWQQWLMDKLLDLAVKCVAKGGILSLAGCSLLHLFCANAAHSALAALLLPKCANAIWMACRYSLFPIRMLIAQFFINSTDFSGDLGQMKVSYRLGLDPSEAEERIENVYQLANQVFRLDGQIAGHRGDNGKNNEGKGEENEEDATDGSNENAAHFPAKFAYLFLFEGASGNGAKKLSMGLDELMDSLLCQQLLVQLAAEQLTKILSTEAEEDAMAPLVGSLCATLAICEQFEMRPGLKSLLQKLTGLPSSANIWTLYMTAANALIKFWIGNELRGQRKHLKQILHLLARIGGAQEKCQNLEEQKERKGVKKTSSIRSNPFISQQFSQESQSTKNAEAAKVRILAFGKLLKFVEMELLENIKQNDTKEFAYLLSKGIRKMIEGWKNKEENENEKAREILEEMAKKLEEI